MKHSLQIAFALALICAVGQASFIEDIFNNTKIEGKGTLSTAKGLNMGYRGGITFNLRGHEIKLIGVGVNFKAVPEVSGLKDNKTTLIRYSGNVSFDEVTDTASTIATISGAALIVSSIDTIYDNTTQTTIALVNNSFSDSNSFEVKSGATQITGKSSESLGSHIIVESKGSNVRISQSNNLAGNVRGDIVQNGTSLGAFAASTQTTSRTREQATMHNCKWLPNVTYSGRTDFDNANSLSFQNTNYSSTKNGGASFIGYTNIKGGGGGDMGVLSAAGLIYDYKTSAHVNDTALGSSNVKGFGHVVTTFDSNNTANGSRTGYYTGGNVYQVAQNTIGADQGPQIHHLRRSVNKDSTSFHSALAAGWRAGSLTTTQATSNASVTTNTTTGYDYKAKGIDTLNWKPWSVSGGEYVDSSFNITQVGDHVSTIDNVTINASSNPNFLNEMAQIHVP